MTALPSGTVTFLFTDVEGSTRLLAELGAERYAEVLAEHRRVLRAAFIAHSGVELGTEGDSFFVAFARAGDALAAATDAQRELGGAVLVRMGIHTGEPLLTDGGYVGMDVHRAARIAAAGHGGQVLVSQATRDLVPDGELRDLGEHRLKDLTRAERIWQLGDREFPPLASLHRTRLPVAAAPLVGRENELARIEFEMRAGTRLLTITGTGGAGKTRLALQAAAELSDHFAGGTYFVPLAPLSEAAALRAAVARALELQPDDDVVERLESVESLLVLDNAEHLAGVEHEVAKLRVGDTALLVTSRAPLRLSGEHELALDPLPEDDAVTLFAARAADRGRALAVDETVREICRRLDNLPLAVELAAARLAVLSPSALLERLDRALPLLTSGMHDVDDRQRTLRAAIDWSFRLLTPPAQRALRRLAIFRGGFTLDAAEAVAGAILDTVSEIVDQSLLRRTDDSRYLMLETIREFALEERDDDLDLAHAQYYLDRLRAIEPHLRGHRMADYLLWYRSEVANVEAALDEFVSGGREASAWELAVLLYPYWVLTGGMRRAIEWLQRELPRCADRTPVWIRARIRLGDLLLTLGSVDDARQILSEVEPLVVASGDASCRLFLYRALLGIDLATRDLISALLHAQQQFDQALELGDDRIILAARVELGGTLYEYGDLESAEELLISVPEAFAARGEPFSEGSVLHLLSNIAYDAGRHDDALAYLDRALEHARAADARPMVASVLTARGFYAMGLGREAEARAAFAEGLDIAVADSAERELIELMDHIAVLSAADNRDAAGRLYSTVSARRAELGLSRLERDFPHYERVLAGTELAGNVIPWDDAVALARSLVARSLD